MKRSIAASLIAIFVCTNVGYAEGLTAEQMKKIIALPDNAQPLPKPLAIYPRASEYRATATVQTPDGAEQKMPEIVIREKFVDGGYIVSSFRPPNFPGDIHMAVYYDKAQGVYRKTILAPDGSVTHSTGVIHDTPRLVAWVTQMTPEVGDPATVIAQEHHGDKQSTWKEVFIVKGKVVQTVVGKATVTKRVDTRKAA